MCSSRRDVRGFTLVELLVVIGIVALLIAILMPTIVAARDAGKTLACASNLRQLGIGMIMYAGDHQGWLPYGAWEIDSPHTITTWDELMKKHLGVAVPESEWNLWAVPRPVPVLHCPADHIPRDAPTHPRSYGLVRKLLGGIGSDGEYGFAAVGTHVHTSGPSFSGTYHISAKYQDFRSPSTTLLLVEMPDRYNMVGGSWGGTYVDRPAQQGPFGQCPYPIPNQGIYGNPDVTTHRGKWNYLFADGHVSLLHWRDTLGLHRTRRSARPWGRGRVSRRIERRQHRDAAPLHSGGCTARRP